MPHVTGINLSLLSDPAAMVFVRTLIEKAALLCGFDDKDTGAIVLAVDEACTNVIRHQYNDRYDGRIDIAVESDEQAGLLRVVIRDYGPVRDASLFRGRSLDELRPGGLGLHLINSVMDKACYQPAEGGGMRLELLKHIAANSPKE